MLLAVTPLPRPLTTPPVTNTYFIFSLFRWVFCVSVAVCALALVGVVFVLMTKRDRFCERRKHPRGRLSLRVEVGTTLSRGQPLLSG